MLCYHSHSRVIIYTSSQSCYVTSLIPELLYIPVVVMLCYHSHSRVIIYTSSQSCYVTTLIPELLYIPVVSHVMLPLSFQSYYIFQWSVMLCYLSHSRVIIYTSSQSCYATTLIPELLYIPVVSHVMLPLSFQSYYIYQ